MPTRLWLRWRRRFKPHCSGQRALLFPQAPRRVTHVQNPHPVVEHAVKYPEGTVHEGRDVYATATSHGRPALWIISYPRNDLSEVRFNFCRVKPRRGLRHRRGPTPCKLCGAP
jgi:hypothetical protein